MGNLITFAKFKAARKKKRHKALLMDAKSVTARLRKAGFSDEHFYALAMQGIPPNEWEAALGVDKFAAMKRAARELERIGRDLKR